MRYAAICNTGQKRKKNQDSFGLLEDEKIFIVADGMGGHKGGETASQIAVEEITLFLRAGDTIDTNQTELDIDPDTQRLKNLKQAARQANRAIYREARINPEKSGMGTTIVILQFCEDNAFVAHVGDSRLYRLNYNSIRQVTKDHSRLQELIDANQVAPEEVENYPFKNIITRALGSGMDIDIDSAMFPFTSRDSFLLCSDGISGVLMEEDLVSIISQYGADPDLALRYMAELVEERGSPDNYTAILIIGDDFMELQENDSLEDTGPIEIPEDLSLEFDQEQKPHTSLERSRLDDGNLGEPADLEAEALERATVSEDETDTVFDKTGPSISSEDVQGVDKEPSAHEHQAENAGQPVRNHSSHDPGPESKAARVGLDDIFNKSPDKPTTSTSSGPRKYIIVIVLLLGLYLTLCAINRMTYWVQYNGEENSLDIMKGNFHLYEKESISSIDVVPNELWMMMIQNQEMKSALNLGKSFFRYNDLNRFIARLLMDIGLRYVAEGGAKERLVAVDLFRRGREYGRYEQFTKNLGKALIKVGHDYEETGDFDKALECYKEALSFNSEQSDLIARIENIESKMMMNSSVESLPDDQFCGPPPPDKD